MNRPQIRYTDFVLDCIPANIDVDLFVGLYTGMEMDEIEQWDYLLKWERLIYLMNQSGMNCYDSLKKLLEDKYLFQSYFLYVDDWIIILKYPKALDEFTT